MITKQTAGILFSHGFRLVDKEDASIFTIQSIDETTFYLVDEVGTPHYFRFDEAGTDYWILKRPYSQLTKSIVVEGKEIVPIVELAKIAGFEMKSFEVSDMQMSVITKSISGYREFNFTDNNFGSIEYDENVIYKNHWKVRNQQQLFQKLYSLHFIDLPEGTYKYID